MALELTISATDGESRLGDDLEQARSIVTSYFPEVSWSDASHGTWGDSTGVVEFSIRGSPPTFIFLRVHDTDPTKTLLAMAKEQRWVIADDSSGNLISEHSDTSLEVVKKVIRDAQRRRSPKKRRNQSPFRQLPKVKQKASLEGLDACHGVQSATLIELLPDETSLDLLDVFATLLPPKRGTNHKAPPLMASNDEVLWSDGRRWALLVVGYEDERDWQVFRDQATLMGRCTAKFDGTCVVASDGKRCSARECMFVQRVWRRNKTKVK